MELVSSEVLAVSIIRALMMEAASTRRYPSSEINDVQQTEIHTAEPLILHPLKLRLLLKS
jgi:hypothetical protein